ncbi:hypothetical protein CI41S_56460 [Bradyrhizobium ivorense]|nr:hypothetical protein CI41S_56460 [Bradyrhizobium ivorense]
MARWDDYLDIDPEEFEAGGGLYGRLASLLPQQQSFYQPTQGSPFPQVSGSVTSNPAGSNSVAVPQVPPIGPAAPQPVSSWPRDNGQTHAYRRLLDAAIRTRGVSVAFRADVR